MKKETKEKFEKLKNYFREHHGVAIAFSGGSDSTLLVHVACKYGCGCKAFCINSILQHRDEIEAAVEYAAAIFFPLTLLEKDLLCESLITENGELRCYHCKKLIFSTIKAKAAAEGYYILADGSNASDDPASRPGMKALAELGVVSPLRDAGLTKDEVREISEYENLPEWNRPSSSCLATRIKTGVQITEALIEKTAAAERELKVLGYEVLRVKNDGKTCTLQLGAYELERSYAQKELITNILLQYFESVEISDTPRKR